MPQVKIYNENPDPADTIYLKLHTISGVPCVTEVDRNGTPKSQGNIVSFSSDGMRVLGSYRGNLPKGSCGDHVKVTMP